MAGSTQGIGRAIASVVHHGFEPAPDVGAHCLTFDLTRPDAPALLLECALVLVP